MRQVKFVQLEPGAFLTDVDFLAMTAEQRGVYITLILFLYCNGGKCRLDVEVLSALSNCSNFAQVWEKIKNKFLLKNGKIGHKRVSRELKVAKKRMQTASEKGVKGARSRWHGNSRANDRANTTTIAKERKRNVSEGKETSYSNTEKQSLSSSIPVRVQGLHFNEALNNIIPARSQSDRTCFHNVTQWLIECCAKGRFNQDIFSRVLDYAKEAKGGRRPAAVFMALLKKELGYK